MLGVLHDIDTLLPHASHVQVLHAGLSGSALLGQVLAPGGGLVPSQVVERRRHASVETVVEVFEAGLHLQKPGLFTNTVKSSTRFGNS